MYKKYLEQLYQIAVKKVIYHTDRSPDRRQGTVAKHLARFFASLRMTQYNANSY
jgi:hypothetical protein